MACAVKEPILKNRNGHFVRLACGMSYSEGFLDQLAQIGLSGRRRLLAARNLVLVILNHV
jgi:hypothetical protein